MNKTPFQVLRGHRITEKASALSANLNQYVFEVNTTANRTDVARAVAEQFKTKVERVNILNHPGKYKSGRMTGGHAGRTSRRKVAIVTLKQGERIEIA
jgi:large subunit ribosomal protein L23